VSINRGPFNALVDDTGSGTTGTPWNKQAIKDVILDPVDAAIGGIWIDVPYQAADFTTSGGGSWTTYAPTTWAYSLSNKTLVIALYGISWAIGGTPISLNVRIPGGYVPARTTGGAFTMAHGAGAGTGWWVTENNQVKLYRDILGTPWAAGTNHLSAMFLLNVS
jgi:hypothetical protein